MNMLLKRALPTSCCLVTWFELKTNGDWNFVRRVDADLLGEFVGWKQCS